MGFHADNTNDPKEVRNWTVQLLGRLVCAYNYKLDRFSELDIFPNLTDTREQYLKPLEYRCLLWRWGMILRATKDDIYMLLELI